MKTEVQIAEEFIQKLEDKFNVAHDRIVEYINKHPLGLDANTKTLANLQRKASDIQEDIYYNTFVILPQLKRSEGEVA